MITVGVNSWATVAEADTYFSTSYGRDAWGTFTTASKESLLITAFNVIRQSPVLNVPVSSTDELVKQAQYEMAWYIYGNWTTHQERESLYAQGVREFDISKFGEKLEAPQLPARVTSILDDYITNIGGFAVITRDLPEG